MTTPAGTTRHMVHDQFSAVAANYARSKVHAQGKDLTALARIAQLTGQESVLDAGCGPGPVAMKLAPEAGSVTAVDFSETMLQVARTEAAARGLTQIRFQRSDLEAVPFPDASFDRVVSRYSAHHWLTPHAVLQEFRRLVNVSGHLVLCDVMAPEEPVLDTFLNALELLRDPSHVRDHSTSQWQGMLETAGFEPRVAFTWDLRLEFGPWVQRIATSTARIAALKRLWDDAGADVRAAFQLEEDYTFTVPGAILAGRPR